MRAVLILIACMLLTSTLYWSCRKSVAPERSQDMLLTNVKSFLLQEERKAGPLTAQRIRNIIANIDGQSVRRIWATSGHEVIFCSMEKYTITNKNGYQNLFHGVVFELRDNMIINARVATIRTDMTREAVNANVGNILAFRLPFFSGEIIINELNGRFNLSVTIDNGKIQKSREAHINNNRDDAPPATRLQDGCTDWYLVTTTWYGDGHTEQEWEYLYTTCGECTPTDEPLTTLIVDCTPEGGGSGYAYAHDTNPCDVADSLENNIEFKKKMDSLKQWSASDYHETGYFMTRNADGSHSFTKVAGPQGAGQISLPGNIAPLSGFMHNHYGNTLSVFSVTDLRAMYRFLTEGKMADPGTFTMSLVTGSGTTYMLQIENIDKFRSFGNTYLSSDTAAAIFDTYSYISKYHITQTNTLENNLNGFLWMLKDYNSVMGLKLFEGNINTFGEWQPKGFIINGLGTGGTIINSPCN